MSRDFAKIKHSTMKQYIERNTNKINSIVILMIQSYLTNSSFIINESDIIVVHDLTLLTYNHQ